MSVAKPYFFKFEPWKLFWNVSFGNSRMVHKIKLVNFILEFMKQMDNSN